MSRRTKINLNYSKTSQIKPKSQLKFYLKIPDNMIKTTHCDLYNYTQSRHSNLSQIIQIHIIIVMALDLLGFMSQPKKVFHYRNEITHSFFVRQCKCKDKECNASAEIGISSETDGRAEEFSAAEEQRHYYTDSIALILSCSLHN